jgi:hypothetical protein
MAAQRANGREPRQTESVIATAFSTQHSALNLSPESRQKVTMAQRGFSRRTRLSHEILPSGYGLAAVPSACRFSAAPCTRGQPCGPLARPHLSPPNTPLPPKARKEAMNSISVRRNTGAIVVGRSFPLPNFLPRPQRTAHNEPEQSPPYGPRTLAIEATGRGHSF